MTVDIIHGRGHNAGLLTTPSTTCDHKKRNQSIVKMRSYIGLRVSSLSTMIVFGKCFGHFFFLSTNDNERFWAAAFTTFHILQMLLQLDIHHLVKTRTDRKFPANPRTPTPAEVTIIITTQANQIFLCFCRCFPVKRTPGTQNSHTAS